MRSIHPPDLVHPRAGSRRSNRGLRLTWTAVVLRSQTWPRGSTPRAHGCPQSSSAQSKCPPSLNGYSGSQKANRNVANQQLPSHSHPNGSLRGSRPCRRLLQSGSSLRMSTTSASDCKGMTRLLTRNTCTLPGQCPEASVTRRASPSSKAGLTS